MLQIRFEKIYLWKNYMLFNYCQSISSVYNSFHKVNTLYSVEYLYQTLHSAFKIKIILIDVRVHYFIKAFCFGIKFVEIAYLHTFLSLTCIWIHQGQKRLTASLQFRRKELPFPTVNSK